MQQKPRNSISVWDPLVRVFHWSLVAFFATAYLSAEEAESLHPYAGYAVGLLILFRLVWGVMGTRHALFRDFVRAPGEVIRYLRELVQGRARHYIGHNPAGGIMIVLLLASLSGTVITGLVMLETDVEELHEFFANLTVLLVVFHLLGVVVSSCLHHENLVKAMITGKKEERDHARN
jgi:cytochrome b